MSTGVTQSEFARLANVNRSTVTRWLQSGRIRKGPDGLIDPEQALRQREITESPFPHHQARKEQIDAQKAEAAATGQIPADDQISIELKRETYRLQRTKAARAALELDQLAGSLAERSDLDFVVDDFGHTLRALLEGLADRLTGPIGAAGSDPNAIHKTLDDAAHDLLTEISEHMSRRAQQDHA